MTILTGKQLTDEKKGDGEKVAAGVESTGAPTAVPLTEGNLSDQPRSQWYSAWRRRRLLTWLCAAMLILWLLMAAVVGSILLYRHLHRRSVFTGWCGADYIEEDSGKTAKLQQHVEVDADKEYERIDVPRFGPNHPATFVHDFRQNLTAIVDVLGQQCFLKPLDRRQVAPPSSFIDLIRKMETGYYTQNTAVIRETYRVRLPPLTQQELEDLGSWMIEQQCSDFVTFMLEKTGQKAARRRREANCEEKSFVHFGGPSTIEANVEMCV